MRSRQRAHKRFHLSACQSWQYRRPNPTKWVLEIFAGAGTHNSTNKWTLALISRAGSTLYSFDSFLAGWSTSTWNREERNINSARTVATDEWWKISITETGTTFNLLGISGLHYRLVG